MQFNFRFNNIGSIGAEKLGEGLRKLLNLIEIDLNLE